MGESTVIYCRISLDRSGEELGVERQEADCRAFAEARGWEVTEVFVDNDLSAFSGKERPEFERLLVSGAPRIVTWHTDRLVRVTADLERVIALGVNVYAVKAGHLDLSTPAGRAVARTLTAWAQYEGEQKGLRQQAMHSQRRAKGKPWWTRRPFGYNKDGTLREPEATLLRSAYDAVLEGASINSIARAWRKEGIVSTVGKPIRTTSLRQLLINPRNIGKVTANGQELDHEGTWEPLVDEITFRRLERLLRTPGRRATQDNRRKGLLTSVLVCGKCGGPMGLASQKQNGKTYEYYACRSSHNSWPRAWLDQHMEESALAVLEQHLPQEETPETAPLHAELKRLHEQVVALKEDRLVGRLSTPEWREAHDRTVEMIKTTNAALSAIEGPQMARLGSDGATREELLELWADKDVDYKRKMIVAMFGKVTAQPRGRGSRSEPDRLLLTFDTNNFVNKIALRKVPRLKWAEMIGDNEDESV